MRAIIQRFPDSLRMGGLFRADRLEYREPFFGAGAVGFYVLKALGPGHRVWLNDRDYGMVCLWNAVRHTPEELCQRVRQFVPSVEAFYRFRDEDHQTDRDVVETGFRKLALHQISFSGLGVKAGGPIGGRKQSSAFNVNCRWNPSRLCREIIARHRLLRRFAHLEITAKDFSVLIDGAPEHAFVYADPPYMEKGPQLYKYNLSAADHQRLAAALRSCRASWVLSYDDHPTIRDLYAWAEIHSVSLTYTTAVAVGGVRRKNSEIVIAPKCEPIKRTA